jgi:hypothetical protein
MKELHLHHQVLSPQDFSKEAINISAKVTNITLLPKDWIIIKNRRVSS